MLDPAQNYHNSMEHRKVLSLDLIETPAPPPTRSSTVESFVSASKFETVCEVDTTTEQDPLMDLRTPVSTHEKYLMVGIPE